MQLPLNQWLAELTAPLEAEQVQLDLTLEARVQPVALGRWWAT